jgi:hypothetical protein
VSTRLFGVALLVAAFGVCTSQVRPLAAVQINPVDPGACATPVGDVLLIALGEIEVVGGETVPLEVGSSSHPSAFEALPSGCTVTWTVTPAGRGASITATSGTVTIASDATTDSVFEARAGLADGREVKNSVRVVLRGRDSMIGLYREVSRVTCDGGEAAVPANPIGELEFMGDGTFRATWVPLEVRYDYWGTYAHDVARSTLTLAVTGGNHVPGDLDETCTVVFEGDDTLRLRDLWLGSSSSGPETPSCQQIFSRIQLTRSPVVASP